MTKKTRIAALLLAAAVLTVMLCSAFYLALEAGHDCIGDGCAICCQIAVCRNVLKKLLPKRTTWRSTSVSRRSST